MQWKRFSHSLCVRWKHRLLPHSECNFYIWNLKEYKSGNGVEYTPVKCVA